MNVGTLTSHSFSTLSRTTMSDPNHSCQSRLKGKFKGLLDQLTGADSLRNERPSGLRLEFMTPIPADGILTSMFTRALGVTGEGSSLVC